MKLRYATDDSLKNAEENAKASLENIQEMVKRLEDENTREEAQEEIQEDPLEIQVRSAWYTPGQKSEPGEFFILLCTGGPAVRIIGQLNEYAEPEQVTLEFQDWFTLWTEAQLDNEERQALLTYARQFYYGE